MKTKITSPKIPSTKNLYGKASWMEVRFDDLMRKIEKNKRGSEVIGKVTLRCCFVLLKSILSRMLVIIEEGVYLCLNYSLSMKIRE